MPRVVSSAKLERSRLLAIQGNLPGAREEGRVAILMGAGVGVSTRGIPQPGASPEDVPTDGYYWISRVQDYLRAPVAAP